MYVASLMIQPATSNPGSFSTLLKNIRVHYMSVCLGPCVTFSSEDIFRYSFFFSQATLIQIIEEFQQVLEILLIYLVGCH